MSYFATGTSKQSSLAQNKDSVTLKSICPANHIQNTINSVRLAAGLPGELNIPFTINLILLFHLLSQSVLMKY